MEELELITLTKNKVVFEIKNQILPELLNYLMPEIKNQIINELKKDYFLIKKSGNIDISDINLASSLTFVYSIIDTACELFKIDREGVLSNIRKRPYTDVRYLIFICCRECLKYPIPFAKISEPFSKHHSTVLHGYNKGLGYAEFNIEFADDLRKLKEAVSASFSKIEN